MSNMYSFTAVCVQLGLVGSTLRAWETRYKAVEPKRLANNRRVYTSSDVRKLKLLMEAKLLGHSIAQIAAYDIPMLEALLGSAAMESKASSEAFLVKGDIQKNIPSVIKRAMKHLDNYDLVNFQDELYRLRSRVNLKTFVLSVLLPLFRMINQLVKKEQLSVSKERAFYPILKALILNEIFLSQKANRELRKRSKSILPTVTLSAFGDDHDIIYLLMAAALCSDKGCIVNYLGLSVPALSLAKAAHAMRASVVFLSSPKVKSDAAFCHDLSYIEELSANIPRSFQIWFGGPDAHHFSLKDIPQITRKFTTLTQLDKHLGTLSSNHPAPARSKRHPLPALSK